VLSREAGQFGDGLIEGVGDALAEQLYRGGTGIWAMTIPVCKGGTCATTSPDGVMTDVGPYPMWVSPRSPVTSADTSHMPVSLTRSARI
jgi:hypothetical protein